MEDAPQVQLLARLDEGWTAEAPAEAEQDAITKSAIVAAAASFLVCARASGYGQAERASPAGLLGGSRLAQR
jgi:hypothetical protein